MHAEMQIKKTREIEQLVCIVKKSVTRTPHSLSLQKCTTPHFIFPHSAPPCLCSSFFYILLFNLRFLPSRTSTFGLNGKKSGKSSHASCFHSAGLFCKNEEIPSLTSSVLS